MVVDDEAELLDRVEQVTIESLQVGDYFSLPSVASPSTMYCVMSRVPWRFAHNVGATGWQVVLVGGGSLWLPRRATVSRRRFGAAARRAAPLRRAISR